MHKQTSSQKLDTALQRLAQEGYRVIYPLPPRPFLSWECPVGHFKRTRFYDIASGHLCNRCRQINRLTPPRKPDEPAVGERSGDLEVVEYLGVINGHSMVLVKNITNTVQKRIWVSNFRVCKQKLLDGQQLQELLKRNGLNRKGHKNTKNSKWTLGRLDDLLKPLGILRITEGERELPCHSSNKMGVWWFRCRCGRDFTAKLCAIQSGQVTSCSCSKSGAQLMIADFLRDLGQDVRFNDRSVLGGPELDIWLPEKNLAIEYGGLYWHKEMRNGKKPGVPRSYHLDKLKECQKLGIRLITVFEDEWIFSGEAVKSYLRSVLRRTGRRLEARKLSLRLSNATKIEPFIKEHHIQGAGPKCSFYAGLFEGEEIVGAISCRKTRGGRGSIRWELVRYCVKGGCSVVGGFDRLFSAFIKAINPAEVWTFSDNRWSAGGLYERAGFTYTGDVPISYSYFKIREMVRYHKSNFQKSRISKHLGPLLPNETESEAMLRFGYDRVWDCGLRRYVWKP